MYPLITRLGIGLLAITTTAFVACGGDDDSSTAPAPTATQAMAESTATQEAMAAAMGSIGVTLSDFAVATSEASIDAGEVTFDITNSAEVPHEFVVIRTDSDATALPVAAGSVDESGLDVVGRTEQIEGGASESVTFTLTAGNYVLICNIPAHYGLGMSTAFTVN